MFSISFLFQSLWREVGNYPLHTRLQREDSYCFMFVNRLGEKVGNNIYIIHRFHFYSASEKNEMSCLENGSFDIYTFFKDLDYQQI